METKNLEDTVQTRMNGAPMYTARAVASVSERVTINDYSYTFSARALRIEAPHCEAYAVWYKGTLQPRLYRSRETAIKRARRLITADVRAVKAERPAPL